MDNNRYNQSHRAMFAPRAPLLLLCLLLAAGSDAFHTDLFRENGRYCKGLNFETRSPPRANIWQPFAVPARKGIQVVMLATTGGVNDDPDKAALKSMLDQAVMISSRNGEGATPEL